MSVKQQNHLFLFKIKMSQVVEPTIEKFLNIKRTKMKDQIEVE